VNTNSGTANVQLRKVPSFLLPSLEKLQNMEKVHCVKAYTNIQQLEAIIVIKCYSPGSVIFVSELWRLLENFLIEKFFKYPCKENYHIFFTSYQHQPYLFSSITTTNYKIKTSSATDHIQMITNMQFDMLQITHKEHANIIYSKGNNPINQSFKGHWSQVSYMQTKVQLR
jgi:hypothetical protein